MLPSTLRHVGALAAERGGRWAKRFPFILLVLVPGWFTAILIDRETEDTDQLFFFHIPDLIENPLVIPVNLLVTPLVNTEIDQIILVTVLVGTFGVLVERRLGTLAAFAIFWGVTVVAAVGAGFLLHALYPMFPQVEVFDSGWNRVFNGGSAGGFGLMGAFAATARLPWVWLGIFFIWEPGFWILVSQDYTPAFHFLAITSGYAASRFYFRPRAIQRGAETCSVAGARQR
jgi:hypothetical protein